MARIRKFVAYRRLERPYTRSSKFKKNNFVRARPHSNIVRFEMGNPTGKFTDTLNLISPIGLQIRHNAIEAARQTTNKLLENKVGKKEYHFKIKMYPFHVLRENPLASGAGADRMSTGMKKSFGKPIGVACQVKPGKVLMQVRVNKAHLSTAKQALKKASHKLPCTCKINIT